MALVVTPLADSTGASIHSIGDLWLALFTLTFSGSYSTGGETLDFLSALGGPVGPGSNVVLTVDVDGGPGYTFEYDIPNKKLRLFSSANTELAAGAYNAAVTGDARIIAKVYIK